MLSSAIRPTSRSPPSTPPLGLERIANGTVPRVPQGVEGHAAVDERPLLAPERPVLRHLVLDLALGRGRDDRGLGDELDVTALASGGLRGVPDGVGGALDTVSRP